MLPRNLATMFLLAGIFFLAHGTRPHQVEELLSSRLMIGSDFPHPDGTAPNTISMLEARPGLTTQDRMNLLGGMAAKIFWH